MNALRTVTLSTLTATLSLFAGCGGGGGNGNDAPQPPEFDLTGRWEITENVTASSDECDDGPQPPYSVQVAQDVHALTVAAPAGTFTGTISGRTVSWTGSYPEDGGTTTIRSMSLQATATTLTGTASWSWTDGTFSCSGTTQVSGRKLGSAGAALGSDDGTGELLFVCDDEVAEADWIAEVRGEDAAEIEVRQPLFHGAVVELPGGRYTVTVRAPRYDGAAERSPIGRLSGIRLLPGELEVVPIEIGR